MDRLDEYSEHIKSAARETTITAYTKTQRSICGHDITIHIADINDYRVLFWSSEKINFATCTCLGFMFKNHCKHEYTLRKKAGMSNQQTSRQTSTNKETNV